MSLEMGIQVYISEEKEKRGKEGGKEEGSKEKQMLQKPQSVLDVSNSSSCSYSCAVFLWLHLKLTSLFFLTLILETHR